MTPLGWLLGFLLQACGANGAAGLPTPMPMDMTHIARPATPNTFLAGPADMTPKPDLVTDPEPMPAAALYDAARAVFSAEPRTYVAAEFTDRRQIHYVVRSALLNFPDLVTVQVDAAADHQSVLVIWSRSVYGRSDLGVNRQRVKSWLAALRHTLEK